MRTDSSIFSLILKVIAPAASLAFLPATVFAADVEPDKGFVPDEVVKVASEASEVEEDQGWDFFARLGLSGSWAGSKNVIGSVDGNTWTLGGAAHHGAYYITRNHEWHNDTRFLGTFTRTPIIDDWVKSNDEFDFLSMYLYRLEQIRWVGPFGRFRFRTQLFPGADVRTDPVVYSITRADGSVNSVTGERLHLTDAFSPLTFRQTAGAFLKPETPPQARFEALVGFGARQTIADGQFIVADDAATPVIEVRELQSFYQAGSEMILSVTGELDNGRLTYTGSAGFMTPFINSLPPGDERSALDLTNIEVVFGISLRPYDWLSIDYQFKAVKEPQLLDEFQLTNRLLVGISYTLIDRRAE